MTTAADLAATLGLARREGNSWRCLCPAHADHDPSLSLRGGEDGRVLFVCRAGCSQDAVIAALRRRGLWSNDPPDPGAERIYDYRDEAGALRYQVVRKPGKKFVQRRPDGAGGWAWNMQGVAALPYRLPALLTAPGDEPVFVVEGEKDVDNLAAIDLAATCNHGGAEKWRAELNHWLARRDVVILPDNDAPGRRHAQRVAQHLSEVALRVRVLELPDLPAKGDVSDWLAAGGSRERLLDLAAAVPEWRVPRYRAEDAMTDPFDDEETPHVNGNGHAKPNGHGPGHVNVNGATLGEPEREPIVCQQLDPLPVTKIPPRPWAYGHFLLLHAASVLAAIDGGGKGAHAVAIALSMITGRALLGEKVWRRGPVVIVSYEDDMLEWRRRIAAACMHYGLDYDSVCSDVYFISRPRHQITFAARLANARGERIIAFPDRDDIIAHLRRIKPALLIVDPFNRAHSLEDGNSNVMISIVAGEISDIAKETGVAALVLHHLRKGATGQADDLMGATALRSTFRAARILLRMTHDEATGFNLPPDEAWRYSRIAAGKENYTRPENARWYRLEGVELGNTDVDPIYPEGDDVAVIETWTPPDAFEGLAKAAIAEIFDAFRTGPGGGEFYSAHGSATHKGSEVISRIAGKTPEEARRILRTWKDKGVIGTDETYYSPKRKDQAPRITIDEAKAQAILGGFDHAF